MHLHHIGGLAHHIACALIWLAAAVVTGGGADEGAGAGVQGLLRGVAEEILFFFQAEDGIRDCHVTGVQTCALPILVVSSALYFRVTRRADGQSERCNLPSIRSEERRVGKSVDLGGRRIIKKKK